MGSVKSNRSKERIYENYFKRPFDIALALILIILFSPLYLLIIVLIYINMGRPIFFKQPRVGHNEKIFTIYKFRTMLNLKDEQGNLLPNHLRMCKFGNFLRSTSLDELPELFNILKGDMSFIGPRPLLVEYLPLYNEFQRRRHEVRPGLSGLAQVNGRNKISWEQKFELDVYYIDHISFLLDLKIILLTIEKVLIREGINQSSVQTMEDFTGSGENKNG